MGWSSDPGPSTCCADNASNLATACVVEADDADAWADAFEAHGMTFAFGPKKPALLVNPRALGTKSACFAPANFWGDASLLVIRKCGVAGSLP